jgi:hypothetical protein
MPASFQDIEKTLRASFEAAAAMVDFQISYLAPELNLIGRANGKLARARRLLLFRAS